MKPQSRRGDATTSGRERIYIEHDAVRRPFMRGILVHSLMARGLAFEDAYASANAVRERLRGRSSVTVEDLGVAVQYWRNICFAMGGDAPVLRSGEASPLRRVVPDQFGCGKAGAVMRRCR